MIISASTDYRAAAQRRLPPFLFHYADGGAYAEHTLRHNVSDLAEVGLRQRVLKNMEELSLETQLFDETLSMPVALAPVGLTGMFARRGEVQAARAAESRGIPFMLPAFRAGQNVYRKPGFMFQLAPPVFPQPRRCHPVAAQGRSGS